MANRNWADRFMAANARIFDPEIRTAHENAYLEPSWGDIWGQVSQGWDNPAAWARSNEAPRFPAGTDVRGRRRGLPEPEPEPDLSWMQPAEEEYGPPAPVEQYGPPEPPGPTYEYNPTGEEYGPEYLAGKQRVYQRAAADPEKAAWYAENRRLWDQGMRTAEEVPTTTFMDSPIAGASRAIAQEARTRGPGAAGVSPAWAMGQRTAPPIRNFAARENPAAQGIYNQMRGQMTPEERSLRAELALGEQRQAWQERLMEMGLGEQQAGREAAAQGEQRGYTHAEKMQELGLANDRQIAAAYATAGKEQGDRLIQSNEGIAKREIEQRVADITARADVQIAQSSDARAAARYAAMAAMALRAGETLLNEDASPAQKQVAAGILDQLMNDGGGTMQAVAESMKPKGPKVGLGTRTGYAVRDIPAFNYDFWRGLWGGRPANE